MKLIGSARRSPVDGYRTLPTAEPQVMERAIEVWLVGGEWWTVAYGCTFGWFDHHNLGPKLGKHEAGQGPPLVAEVDDTGVRQQRVAGLHLPTLDVGADASTRSRQSIGLSDSDAIADQGGRSQQ
jgi:hypothetical protein